MKRCLFCANPDLNLIDGSSVWAQTFALALAETGKVHVDFLAKARPARDELYQPLHDHPMVTVFDGTHLPTGDDVVIRRLNAGEMVERARHLHGKKHYDFVVVRGQGIAQAMRKYPELLKKTWLYLTDIPHEFADIPTSERRALEELALSVRRVLCQSEGFRRLWRQIAPGLSSERCVLYTPVVPDKPDELIPLERREPVAIYAGKFKPEWNTLEMARAWPRINGSVPNARLVVIGDKFHKDSNNPDYVNQMRNALENTPNLNWLGAMSRREVQECIENARLGLSWRKNTLDAGLEYSTKILEYGRAKCPAILNRNPIHERLLGYDYPLFANSDAEFKEKVILALRDLDVASQAADRLSDVAQGHSFNTCVARIKQWIDEETEGPGSRKRSEHSDKGTRWSLQESRKLRMLVAGHDMKFFTRLGEMIERDGNYEIYYDQWSGHDEHDEERSKYLLQFADVVFCEWSLGNLEWYSKHIKESQRLVTRFHLQERDLPYFQRADFDRVDHVGFVGEHIRREVLEKTRFPEEKTSTIGNLMDSTRFAIKRKMAASAFTLGMIGVVPARKRIDRALDVLGILLKKDPRYKLRVKGRLPYDYPWLVNRNDEVGYFRDVFRNINSGVLRHSVIFDPPDDRVPEWLSLVGHILSPSDFESFHLAVGEGMLTGALPVVWNWEGAEELWPESSVVASEEEAAEHIHEKNQLPSLESEAEAARDFVMARYSERSIVEKWCSAIEGQ